MAPPAENNVLLVFMMTKKIDVRNVATLAGHVFKTKLLVPVV
jgi:hypothetical protein